LRFISVRLPTRARAVLARRVWQLQPSPVRPLRPAGGFVMNRNTCQSLAALSGRVFLSAIFLFSAFGKIADWSKFAHMMDEKGMPFVPVLLAGALTFELLGGLSVLLGFYGRVGAVLLILFLIPTTLIFHNFWAADAAMQQNQMQHFMKNVAIMGGLFVVAALGTDGFSVDRWMRRTRTAQPMRARRDEPVMVG
jgi:putative oxidoreductase